MAGRNTPPNTSLPKLDVAPDFHSGDLEAGCAADVGCFGEVPVDPEHANEERVPTLRITARKASHLNLGRRTVVGLRPRLLSGLSMQGIVGSPIARALLVRADGTETEYEALRLPDLARKLKHASEGIESFMQALRFLQDRSKSDFVLQPCKHGVLVRSHWVRALVDPSRIVFLAGADGTFQIFLEEFRSELRYRLAASDIAEDLERHRPFHVWATECIVCAAVALHNMRLHALRPVVGHILDNVRLSNSHDSIMQLYPLKVTLLKFVEQVRPLVMCLNELVHNESDSSHLSHLPSPQHQGTPKTRTSPRSLQDFDYRRSDAWTEAEHEHHSLIEMLDFWLHNASEIMADASEMGSSIEDATRFIESSLSYTRNELLTLELLALAITIVLGFGSFIVGIWGMNLDTSFMHVKGAFWMVLGFIAIVSAGMLNLAFRLFKRSFGKYELRAAQFGNNKFFRNIDDDAYLLSTAFAEPEVADGFSLTDTAVHRLLRDLHAAELPVLRVGGDGGLMTAVPSSCCSAEASPRRQHGHGDGARTRLSGSISNGSLSGRSSGFPRQLSGEAPPWRMSSKDVMSNQKACLSTVFVRRTRRGQGTGACPT
eukprot:TRINITY_DN70085_c0_g1_i1.p1 TRINITY_DN70085_c0_g1~~TRINITY_DN70085_c0_g1_i1.p1  ORF type:complete len:600 (-),score=59.55 TRINITY_DN70085_c0_g1_i1:14-1813(-)